MSNSVYDIFISFRREGGYDTAKHLNDLLVRDGYRVSFDIDTLRSGDFDTQLLQRIDQCKDFYFLQRKGNDNNSVSASIEQVSSIATEQDRRTYMINGEWVHVPNCVGEAPLGRGKE